MMTKIEWQQNVFYGTWIVSETALLKWDPINNKWGPFMGGQRGSGIIMVVMSTIKCLAGDQLYQIPTVYSGWLWKCIDARNFTVL